MSTLHLMRTSAYQQNDLTQCLDLLQASDAIVLLDDGCYNLSHHLLTANISNPIYHINEHAIARAMLDQKKISQAITLAELPALFFTFDKVITWQ